jgi:hypothetical protein
MKKKLVVVRWTDPATHSSQNVVVHETHRPMVYKITTGFLYGEHKDHEGTKFYRICQTFDTDSSNDDFIDIPVSIVKEIIATNVEMDLKKEM